MSKVTGADKILANLQKQAGAFNGTELDQQMKAALEPMRQATVQNAIRRRQAGKAPAGGHLDQGVVTRKMKSRRRGQRTFWIAFTRRARRIAHLVEFGTAPHFQPKRGTMHPGARPYPFFRPAFEAHKGGVVSGLSSWIWNRIVSAAKK